MNQKLKKRLQKTIEISQCLLEGKVFCVSDSEIDYVPVPVMTRTAAKKRGLVLKRGAKPVGSWGWQIPTGGRANGDLYLSERFKKAKEQ
jgi:hypothetical protein